MAMTREGDIAILSKHQVRSSESDMLLHSKNLASPIFEGSGANLLWQKFGLQPFAYSSIQLLQMILTQYEKQMRFPFLVIQYTRLPENSLAI